MRKLYIFNLSYIVSTMLFSHKTELLLIKPILGPYIVHGSFFLYSKYVGVCIPINFHDCPNLIVSVYLFNNVVINYTNQFTHWSSVVSSVS